MPDVHYSQAIAELHRVIDIHDRKERGEAFARWGGHWLLQFQADAKLEQDLRTMTPEVRASSRREMVEALARAVATQWLDDALEYLPLDERTERGILTLVRGRPNLYDVPDAVVIPLRPKR